MLKKRFRCAAVANDITLLGGVLLGCSVHDLVAWRRATEAHARHGCSRPQALKQTNAPVCSVCAVHFLAVSITEFC